MVIPGQLRISAPLLLILILTACTRSSQTSEPYENYIEQALTTVNLNMESISLPKIPRHISAAARLSLVNSVLEYPPGVIATGKAIRDAELETSRSQYIADIFGLLETGEIVFDKNNMADNAADTEWNTIINGLGTSTANRPPKEWYGDEPVYKALRKIALAVEGIIQLWNDHGGKPTATELARITPYLNSLLESNGINAGSFNSTPESFNHAGERADITVLTTALLRLFITIENVLPDLSGSKPLSTMLDWETPFGLIRIAGQQNDMHEGAFLLLIDLGGDDTYTNVAASREPGSSLVVIDIDGNDKIIWDGVAGPGSGILGTGVWLDANGNDSYEGGNLGLGSGLIGSGLFWDDNGNDTYNAGAFVQGIGHYGTGIFVDRQGQDLYTASISAQGYGNPGGIGILVDYSGDDKYDCGGKVPDPVKSRANRHLGKHYLSLCQGYSYGQRPDISGGIGLLLDKSGNDVFNADIFAQGSAYWFGLGLLIDGSGDDTYNAFEHAQGEGLHLGAGFLGDWEGDDKYTGFEHVQGVGIDRASGILYDDSGDDTYTSSLESQGTGVKSYGVGILIDNMGNDTYVASRASQGYAQPDMKFPEAEWPTGILLDLDGDDVFKLPYSEAISNGRRVQNRQGVIIDKLSNL